MSEYGTPGRPDRAARTERERRVLLAFEAVFEQEEPLPERLVEAAQASYTWRTFDAELLDLLVDSTEDELAAVREEQLQRFMVFGTDEHGVHFECDQLASGTGFELSGTIVPPGPYVVRVEQPPDEMAVETDDAGAFRLTGLRAGNTRLTIRGGADDHLMVTPWFMLRDSRRL